MDEMIEAGGLRTRVRVSGSGEPLLMFSPGGFNATLDQWSALGLYKKIEILSYLEANFTCIMFDRRECGASAGRLEILTFDGMAQQGLAVLDQLGYKTAHLLGGCLGCAPALSFSYLYPEKAESLNLIWPVGGPRYRLRNFGRFATHFGWVSEHGLDALVDRALSSDVGFAKDSMLGPWGSSLRVDEILKNTIFGVGQERYLSLVQASYRAMFDTDSAPGPTPEELMQIRNNTSIVPGADESHARSAAHFLNECLCSSSLLDLPTSGQTSESVFSFFDTFYET